MATEKIDILATLRFNGTQASKSLKDFSGDMNAVKIMARRYGVTTSELSKGIRENQFAIVGNKEKLGGYEQGLRLARIEGGKLTKISEMNKKIIEQQTSKYKEFNFKLLSYLFLAQSASSATMGLFKSNFALAGIFEATGKIIDVALLPSFLKFSEFLLDLSIKFNNLPESTRGAIGTIILITGVAATAAVAISMLGLAFGGVGVALSILGGILAGAIFVVYLGKLYDAWKKFHELPWDDTSNKVKRLIDLLILSTPIGLVRWATGLGNAEYSASGGGVPGVGYIPSFAGNTTARGPTTNSTIVQNFNVYDSYSALNQMNTILAQLNATGRTQ